MLCSACGGRMLCHHIPTSGTDPSQCRSVRSTRPPMFRACIPEGGSSLVDVCGSLSEAVRKSIGFAGLVARTVWCAIRMRFRTQCGHCSSWLIRRAALYAANVDDLARYRWDDLKRVMSHENLRYDLMAVARAVIRCLETEDAEKWVVWSWPPLADGTERQACRLPLLFFPSRWITTESLWVSARMGELIGSSHADAFHNSRLAERGDTVPIKALRWADRRHQS